MSWWIKEYVSYDGLEDQAYYFVKSRGGPVAMWSAEKNRFLVPSSSMGQQYLETEYHWDQHSDFGTVKPLRKLGMVPKGVDLKKFLFDIDPEPLCEEFRAFMREQINLARDRCLDEK